MRLFHATHVPLGAGDELLPAALSGTSIWGNGFLGEEWRRDRVWLSASPQDAADWRGGWHVGGQTIVVEVHAPEAVRRRGRPRRRGITRPRDGRAVAAPTATVIRVIPPARRRSTIA